MSQAARLTDTGSAHGCFPPTPVTSGSPNVSINGLPAARKGDSVLLHACPCPYMPHGIHGRAISAGSSSVSVNGKPAARLGDAIDCGGSISTGSSNVFIGDTPWRSPAQDCIARAAKEGVPLLRISPLPETPPAEAQPSEMKSKAATEAEQQVQQRIARYQCRNTLADKAEKIPELAQSARRLRFNNDSILYAESADAAYAMSDYYMNDKKTPYPDLSVGLHEVEPGRIGLQQSDFFDRDSGFSATLFYSEINKKYIVAVRGTRLTSGKDWGANFTQGLGGDADQYKKAIILGQKLKKACADNPGLLDGKFCSDLVIAGHSLGGGMGAVMMAVSGFPAYTYNAAGLNKNTIARAAGKTPDEMGSKINNYFVRGEILSTLQQHVPLLPGAAGKQIPLANTATGLPGMQPVTSAMQTLNKYTSGLITRPLKFLANATDATPLKKLLNSDSLMGLLSAGAAGKYISKIVGYTLGAASIISLADTIVKSVKGHFIKTVTDGIELQKQADIQHITSVLKGQSCDT